MSVGRAQVLIVLSEFATELCLPRSAYTGHNETLLLLSLPICLTEECLCESAGLLFSADVAGLHRFGNVKMKVAFVVVRSI